MAECTHGSIDGGRKQFNEGGGWIASHQASGRAADTTEQRHDAAIHLLAHFLMEMGQAPNRAWSRASTVIEWTPRLLQISDAATDEMAQILGSDVRTAKALQLALQLGYKMASGRPTDFHRATDRESLIQDAMAAIGAQPVEFLRLYLFDSGSHLIAMEQTQGLPRRIPVQVPALLRRAILWQASSAIIVHNHPSGDPSPSNADLVLTRDLALAFARLEMQLVDHVIVCESRFLSMHDAGLL